MIHPVTIYNAEGKVKKVISTKKLVKDHWKNSKGHLTKFKNNDLRNARRRKKMQNWVCETCKEVFQAARERKFCHDPCEFVDKRHKPLSEKLCDICHELYMPTGNSQKYCKDPCDKFMAKKLRDKK